MSRNKVVTSVALSLLALGLTLVVPARVLAHCDGLDGPVVKAARKALDTHNSALALMWVQAKDEPEILSAFEQTLAVRALSPQARELADRYFFETLVRIHRAGEGAPFIGLHAAGRDLGPAIPAADKAIDDGSVEPLLKLLTAAVQEGLRARFSEAERNKAFQRGDVATGRAYVKTYVEFIHYAERVYEASIAGAHGHFEEAESTLHGR